MPVQVISSSTFSQCQTETLHGTAADREIQQIQTSQPYGNGFESCGYMARRWSCSLTSIHVCRPVNASLKTTSCLSLAGLQISASPPAKPEHRAPGSVDLPQLCHLAAQRTAGTEKKTQMRTASAKDSVEEQGCPETILHIMLPASATCFCLSKFLLSPLAKHAM